MVEFVSFPQVNNANDDGLLAMGGDLTLDTLVSAYAQGIFPWFNDDQPILWWSPDPRLVLYPDKIKISRSLRKTIRQQHFSLSCNQAFDRVIKACALRGPEVPFATPPDTWITGSMHHAYLKLHQQSYAHSIEVWQDNDLVGGVYGVALGKVFFGESMFSSVSNASKVGLVMLCHWLKKKGFVVVDCQVASDHLFSMGAEEIPRSRFLQYLESIVLDQPKRDFATDFEHVNIEDVIKAI